MTEPEHPADLLARGESPLAELRQDLDKPRHGSLPEALLAFQAEAPKLTKEKTAEVVSKRTGGKYTYKFTPLADIVDKIQGLLTKHGLLWTCDPGENEHGKPVLNYELMHVPSYQDSGELGSHCRKAGTMPLMLADQSSQSHGSALTYGKRQALEAVLNLIAEADDDGKGASAKRPTGDARPLPAAARKRMLAEIEASGKDLGVLLKAVELERVEDITVGHSRQIKALL